MIDMAHTELQRLLSCTVDELIALVQPMPATDCEQHAKAILDRIGGPSYEQVMMRIVETAALLHQWTQTHITSLPHPFSGGVWSADAVPNLWYDLPDRHLCHETWSFHAWERSDCLRQGDDAVRVRPLLLGRATAERDEALARARKGTRQSGASCASQA